MLGFGWNRPYTHPKSPSQWQTIHAELDALLGVYTDTIGLDAAVVRVTKTGLLASSKPCKTCWNLLLDAGIRRVYYVEGRQWTSARIRSDSSLQRSAML